MALANYTDLQEAITAYLDDETLNARIPDFIRLFEVKAQRILRTSGAKNTATAQTDGNGQVNVPNDFRGIVRISAAGKPLRFLTDEDAALRNSYANNRTTYAYSIEGQTITLVPATSVEISLVYYQGVPVLSDVSPTNWLLTSHPDAYLYGSLAEAEAFGFNDNRLATWRSLASDALAQIMGGDLGTEWANAAVLVPDPVW